MTDIPTPVLHNMPAVPQPDFETKWGEIYLDELKDGGQRIIFTQSDPMKTNTFLGTQVEIRTADGSPLNQITLKVVIAEFFSLTNSEEVTGTRVQDALITFLNLKKGYAVDTSFMQAQMTSFREDY